MNQQYCSNAICKYVTIIMLGSCDHDHVMQVVNCSTPANFFHVLRRQVAYPFRKPVSDWSRRLQHYYYILYSIVDRHDSQEFVATS